MQLRTWPKIFMRGAAVRLTDDAASRIRYQPSEAGSARYTYVGINTPRLGRTVNKISRRRRRPERAVPFPKVDAGRLADFRFQATSREPNIGRFGVLLTGFRGVRNQIPASSGIPDSKNVSHLCELFA